MKKIFILLLLLLSSLLLGACAYSTSPYGGYSVSVSPAVLPYFYYSPYRSYYSPRRYITPYYRGYWYGRPSYRYPRYYGHQHRYYGNRGGYFGHRRGWGRGHRHR